MDEKMDEIGMGNYCGIRTPGVIIEEMFILTQNAPQLYTKEHWLTEHHLYKRIFS